MWGTVNKAQQRNRALPKQQFIVQVGNFMGIKFRDTWASHENNENQHPTKITHYTVIEQIHLCYACSLGQHLSEEALPK